VMAGSGTPLCAGAAMHTAACTGPTLAAGVVLLLCFCTAVQEKIVCADSELDVLQRCGGI
jgi:hypothetical protein